MGWFILGNSFKLVLRSTGPTHCSKQENFREAFSRLCPIEFYICNIMEAPQLLSATYWDVWQFSLQKNCLRKKSPAAACILFALSFHSACFSTVVSLTWSKEDVFPELGCPILLLPQYITLRSFSFTAISKLLWLLHAKGPFLFVDFLWIHKTFPSKLNPHYTCVSSFPKMLTLMKIWCCTGKMGMNLWKRMRKFLCLSSWYKNSTLHQDWLFTVVQVWVFAI